MATKKRRRKRKPTNFKGIVNLSKYKPTIEELSLLSKGLKFVPTTYIDPLEIQKDNLVFERQLKLLQYFKDAPKTNEAPSAFKKISGWTPNSILPKHLNCFLVNMENKTKNIDTKSSKFNLPRNERQAIKSLQNNDEIIIRQADKGGAVVIWDRREYLNEAYRQLDNRSHYKPIHKDPTLQTAKEINLYIDKLEKDKILDTDTAAYLKIRNPRTPLFYMLPKIHKEGNPGRPIISQTNGPTEKNFSIPRPFFETFGSQH